jgi:hypothetical protein
MANLFSAGYRLSEVCGGIAATGMTFIFGEIFTFQILKSGL